MTNTTKNDFFFNPVTLEAYTSNLMAKNFVTPRFLNKKLIDAPTVLNYRRDGEENGKLLDEVERKVRPVTEGTELTEVRGTVKIGETKTLQRYGMKLVVTNELLKNPAFTLQDEINNMSLSLARIVEKETIKTLKAEAEAPQSKKIKGKWTNDGTTLDTIQRDIVEMQSAFDDSDFNNELNTLFYNKAQFNEIKKDVNYEVSNYNVDAEEGYNVTIPNRPLDFVDALHYKCKYLDAGEALGWDGSMPPATIYYNRESGLGTPTFYNGLADFAPFVSTYVKDEPGVVPYKEIQMAVSFGVVVNKPGALLYQKGL